MTITAKRPLIEQDIDKAIINVDAMIGGAGNNALEILGKSPGVVVNANNDISLNGKEDILILIDGRPTYMTAANLTAYLKSLPGSLLDKIELIDNPSSKYDAAGGAVINIRLKKSKIAGFTGSITGMYSQGIYAKSNAGINLNYNLKKLNFFANVSYSKETDYVEDMSNRRFYKQDASPASSLTLLNYEVNTFRSLNGRFGMDYAASKATTYGFVVSVNHNPGNGWLDYASNSFDENDQLDSLAKGGIQTNNKRINLGANLNFLHKLNDKGRELSADLNYIRYSFSGQQYIENATFKSGEAINDNAIFYYDLLSAINIYTFKADYAHPLQAGYVLDAGIKSSIVGNDDDSKYFDVQGNAYLPDVTKSNQFNYREQVHAAYTNMRKGWKRLDLQLGLRAEHTNITGKQPSPQSSFSRNYTSVFPSVFLRYKLDSAGKNTLAANISRRIRRPVYQQLNPFLAFRDNYSYVSGNPLLNPQFQYRAEIRYQYKSTLGASLQYGRFTDVMFDITQASGNIFISRPDNVATGSMLIFATNLTLRPATWWDINTNLMLAYMALDGMAGTEMLNLSTNSIRFSVTNQFNFNKGWSGELSAQYAGRDVKGQSVVDPRYRVYAAAKKKILGDKATVGITFDDIFHSWIQEERITSLKQAVSNRFISTDTQRINISFSWRFGKDNFARKRKNNNNAADEEAERLN